MQLEFIRDIKSICRTAAYAVAVKKSILPFFFFFSAAAAAAAAAEADDAILPTEAAEFFLFSLLPSGSCPLSLPLFDPLTSELVTESLLDILGFEAATPEADETEAGGEVADAKGCSLKEGQFVGSVVVAA